MSEEVIDYISSQGFSLLPYAIPEQHRYFVDGLYSYFGGQQGNEYLNKIGFEHSSTLLNLVPIMGIILSVMAVH